MRRFLQTPGFRYVFVMVSARSPAASRNPQGWCSGADAAVAAAAAVTSDVPGGSVVAGVPARVISHAGAVGYINHTDY